MPEPTEGPWVAAPVIKGFPQHPGEVRGPNGPVAYISLAVPIEQRHAAVSVLAAGLEMEAVLERSVYHWNDLDIEARRELMTDARAALAKARGK